MRTAKAAKSKTIEGNMELPDPVFQQIEMLRQQTEATGRWSDGT